MKTTPGFFFLLKTTQTQAKFELWFISSLSPAHWNAIIWGKRTGRVGTVLPRARVATAHPLWQAGSLKPAFPSPASGLSRYKGVRWQEQARGPGGSGKLGE